MLLSLETDSFDWCPARRLSFEDAVALAFSEGRTLRILCNTATVISTKETILLKGNDKILRIIGISPAARPTIESSGHSLFQINGKRSKLNLENLDLRHVRNDVDKRNIGAVVFASNSSICSIVNCDLLSLSGFCVWAIQRSGFIISNSQLTSCSRSGCVAFGNAKLDIQYSSVTNCYQHGICLRGNCELLLAHCRITDSGVRAVYGYEGAQLQIQSCHIENTNSADHSAVELLGFSNEADRENKGGEAITALVQSATSTERKKLSTNQSVNLGKSPIIAASSLFASEVYFKNNRGSEIRLTGSLSSIQLTDCYRFDFETSKYRMLQSEDIVTVSLPLQESSTGEDVVGRVSDDRNFGLFGVTRSHRDFVSKNEGPATADVEQVHHDLISCTWEYHVDENEWRTYPQHICELISDKYKLWQESPHKAVLLFSSSCCPHAPSCASSGNGLLDHGTRIEETTTLMFNGEKNIEPIDDWEQEKALTNYSLSKQIIEDPATTDRTKVDLDFREDDPRYLHLPSPLDKYYIDFAMLSQVNNSTFFSRKIRNLKNKKH